MKRNSVAYILFTLISLTFLGIIILLFPPEKKPEIIEPEKASISFVDEKDTLDVLLFFHASDIFIYRGTTTGFQYDLFKRLEKDLGKHIRLKIEDNYDLIYQELFQDNYDIIALDFAKTPYNLPFLSLSVPHSYSHPVIVSRKKIEKDSIQNDTIFVPSYFNHLVSLSDTFHIPGSSTYHIEYSKQYTSEELFEKIEKGEMDYTICDYNIAITLLPFYSGLTLREAAGPEYERCWILNKKNEHLNFRINQWISELKGTKYYAKLQKKYFSARSGYIQYSNSKTNKYRISPYDGIIKTYAERYEVDWRFVASIIFQECKFIPDLVGYGGSFGLMQMMPVTLEHYGISDTASIDEQICAGIKLIRTLNRYFSEVPEEDKPFFVAAAYNAGPGHIFDAQNLCIKYNENPNSWDCASKYLILKTSSKYYNDPVVTAGYYPGNHSVRYAAEVVERYNAYKLAYK